MIFGHLKWPPAGILSKITNKSEMARNTIEGNFQTSKMAAQTKEVPYRTEMARYAIESKFWTSKIADLSEMARKCD